MPDRETTPRRMTKRAARRWVQLHWAAFMTMADMPHGAPEEVGDIWGEEGDRMAARIATFEEISEWKRANGM